LAVLFGLTACAPKGEALYNRAEKSLGAGEVNAAVIDLKNLVKDEPQNGKARALLAEALLKAGDVNAAAIEIQKAKDSGASKADLLVPECALFAAKGEFDKVLAGCSPDQAQGDDKVALQIAQGQALVGLDRAAEAKAPLQAALAAKPDSLEALLGLAAATYQTDGLKGAAVVLDQASDGVRNRPIYWMTVGSLNAQGGDLPAAEKAYQTAIEKSGKGGAEGDTRPMALGALAEVQMRQGKVKEAEASAEQLLKAAPNNPLVKQLRGQVAAAGGDLEKARMLLEEAVAAMPDNYQARLLLGMVNLKQGNIGQAEMHFSNVVANQPGNVQAQRLLVETRTRSKSPAETLESMKSALAQPDADPSLLSMAGRLSLASGNRDEALSYLAQAAETAKDQSPEVQLDIAGGFLMAGDLDRAIELLQGMPQGGATGYQREYLLMAALLQKGKKDEALAEAKALVERSGDDPQVRNLVASVFSAAGQPDAGRKQFEEALKLKPNDPETLINLARLDLTEGKTADAEQRFRKVLETDPKNLTATQGVAVAAGAQGNVKEAEKFLQKASADHPDSIQAQLALAQFYLGQRNFGQAKAVVEEAAKKAPDNAALSNARGLALLGLNDVPGAIASFTKAVEQAPKAYGFALNLARAELINKNTKGALSVIDNLLKAQPDFSPALALGAAISLQSRDTERAAGYVQRMRQVAPDAPGTFALEGDLAMTQKRYKEALEYYRKASAKGSTRQLAIAEFRAGVLAGAGVPEKPLNDWLAAHPDDVDVLTILATRKEEVGNYTEAVALYEGALQKASNNVVVLNNLAMLYMATGNPKALETAEMAYAAAPEVAAVQDTYGWVLLQQGKTEQALAILAAAYKGLPEVAEVQYHYAAALAKAGRSAEALPILKKAVTGPMPEKAKADAQKLLQELSK
jgi:putative PEP-CTERM system TPR-repeat lipoprotein